jgi:serine/threonine protein kinase
LGEGASATVFLATDTLTGQAVAIKRALDIMARHARFAGRWQREVIVLQTLQHERVVPLIDATFAKGKPLTMVMAFAGEGDLEGKLHNGCTGHEALTWLYQALEGLAHIHSFGVIHQDIKPDNILIGPNGGAWLADFSVARTRAELLTNPQDVTGTPGWYAPEQQLRLASEVGPWTDLFSWGKMLELVISSMSYRTGELAYIVEGCTTLDPQQRFRTSAEVLPLLQEAISGVPTAVSKRRFKVKHRRGMSNLLKEGFQFPEDFVPKSRKGRSSLEFDTESESQINTSPSLLSVVPRFRSRPGPIEDLWRAAKWVKDNQRSKVVFIKGPKGSGRKDIIRHFVRELNRLGVMDSMILSYHENGAFDDGYRGAVQHVLSPWGENRDEFIIRLQRWLAREKQMPIRATKREAAGLAKWCGFLEKDEQAVDNGLGLIFLFQHLQHLAWKGGVVLVLEDPKYCTVNGDGLDICETLLGSDFSKRPVLVLTTIPEDMSAESASFQQSPCLEADGRRRDQYTNLVRRGYSVSCE